MTDAPKDKEKKDTKEIKISSLKRKDRLEEAMRLMEEENLQELEILDGPFQLKLVRESKTQIPTRYGPASIESEPDTDETSSKAEEPERGTPIKAPLGGIFYRALSPKSPPFVKEGDTIVVGQTLGIIEAMKVMNEIKADITGRVVKIMIENGKPVEANQIMLIVEPV